MTPQEAILWQELKNRYFLEFKFRRQQPVDGYIADFCCLKKRLIIELDGSVHDLIDQRQYDEDRNLYLESQGFKILRFRNAAVETNLEYVLTQIKQALSDPSPLCGRGVDAIAASVGGEGGGEG